MTTDLSEQVRTALRHRAEALVVDVVPFDPGLPPTIDLPEPRRRNGPRLLLAAAAVLAVALVAGAVVLAADDGAPGPAATTPTSPPPVTGPTTPPATEPTAPTGPAVALVPTVVPEGLAPTAVSVEDGTAAELLATQLFGSDDGAAQLRITVQATVGGSDGGGPVVRGQAGRSLPSKEHPDTSTALTWSEGGFAYTADLSGLTEAEAIAFLDGLAPRPGGSPLFDAPPGALAAVDEAEGGSYPTRTTTIRYVDGDRALDVRVVDAPEGATRYAWVQARYLGRVDAEGRVATYDPAYDEVVVVGPDGRRVIVTGDGSFGEAALTEVATSVAAIDAATLADLRAGAADGILGATDTVGPVHVLLRDAGGRDEDLFIGVRAAVDDPSAPRVCVLVPDQPAACDGDATRAGVANVLVDGHWYVGLATTDVDVRITRGPPSPGADPVPLPSVSGGEVDGWVLWVAAVPDDVDEVWIGTDLQSGNVLRPTA